MGSDAPFRDVFHALDSIYAEETKVICSASTIFADLRGGTVKIGTPIGGHDRLAQAVFALSLLRRVLPETYMDVLDAFYTRPEGVTLEGRKVLACKMVSERLYQDMDQLPDRWYLNDVVIAWARYAPKGVPDERYWMRRLKKGERTLRLWRNGDSKRAGAIQRLAHLLDGAHRRAAEAFSETGITDSA